MPDFLCTYLLPFRRGRIFEQEITELAAYLRGLQLAGCDVLVVDGSPEEVFSFHARIFGDSCTHLPVAARFRYQNDKVNGIHTGVDAARYEKIILADDDIRYTPETVRSVVGWLDQYEVVRPQNFLRPLPWWGNLEAARMLINRATLAAADYPGSCAFRRETMLRVGHYDGDVLFDNEEIIRHFALKGASIACLPDLFVLKKPPSFRKWLEQRPRQAYEDFSLRAKTALFLLLLPLPVLAALLFGLRGTGELVALIALLSIMLALYGRARGRAAEFFPLACCFFAPLWVAERTFSTYWACYWYFSRRGYPFGGRIVSKGVGRAWSTGGSIISRRVRHQG